MRKTSASGLPHLPNAVYGAYVCTRLMPDCWPDEQRNAGVQLEAHDSTCKQEMAP